jgi:ankyrin repeat protein
MDDSEDANARLLRAVEQDDVDAAQAALAAGAAAGHVWRDETETDRNAVPVLYIACHKKSVSMVGLLLAHGADPNVRSVHERPYASPEGRTDRYDDTCLRAAMPSADVVRVLLDNGADPNLPSERYEDMPHSIHALEDAAGNEELLALLKEHGAKRHKMTPTGDERERKQKAASRRKHKRGKR